MSTKTGAAQTQIQTVSALLCSAHSTKCTLRSAMSIIRRGHWRFDFAEKTAPRHRIQLSRSPGDEEARHSRQGAAVAPAGSEQDPSTESAGTSRPVAQSPLNRTRLLAQQLRCSLSSETNCRSASKPTPPVPHAGRALRTGDNARCHRPVPRKINKRRQQWLVNTTLSLHIPPATAR